MFFLLFTINRVIVWQELICKSRSRESKLHWAISTKSVKSSKLRWCTLLLSQGRPLKWSEPSYNQSVSNVVAKSHLWSPSWRWNLMIAPGAYSRTKLTNRWEPSNGTAESCFPWKLEIGGSFRVPVAARFQPCSLGRDGLLTRGTLAFDRFGKPRMLAWSDLTDLPQ